MPSTTVSRLIQECPIVEQGSLAAFLGTWMVLSVPSESPFDATPPVHCSQDCFARCSVPLHPSTSSGCSTDSLLCAASLGVNPSCLISTSCVLDVPINSPSLGAIAAQYALILKDHVVHRSLPSCSPEHRTSVCAVAVRCAVNYCDCAACNATRSFNCWIFCCCHDSSTTLPVTIVSPIARSSETVLQPQPPFPSPFLFPSFLITKTETTREACTRKHEKRPKARVRRHDQPPNPPQEVNNGHVQDVIMSVVICDSVVHLSISGPHVCDGAQNPIFFCLNFVAISCSTSVKKLFSAPSREVHNNPFETFLYFSSSSFPSSPSFSLFLSSSFFSFLGCSKSEICGLNCLTISRLKLSL